MCVALTIENFTNTWYTVSRKHRMERPVEDSSEIAAEADDIASAITSILVKAFVQKEGRDPTNEEIQLLIEELTEERIESMLNGTDVDPTNGECKSSLLEQSGGEDDEEDTDDEEAGHPEVVETTGEVAQVDSRVVPPTMENKQVTDAVEEKCAEKRNKADVNAETE
jgi:hypothetical protein